MWNEENELRIKDEKKFWNYHLKEHLDIYEIENLNW